MAFLGYDIDVDDAWVRATPRWSRFFAAYGSGSATLPLVMVSSGRQISTGQQVDYARVYRSMVQAELARPAAADLEAWSADSGSAFTVWVRAVNRGAAPLSAENDARVQALVYREVPVAVMGRQVLAVGQAPIVTSVPVGGEHTAVMTVPLSAGNRGELRVIALLDARDPTSSRRYDMLQAATARPAALSVTPAEVVLGAAANQAGIELSGPHVLFWGASTDASWLSITPASGSLPARPTIALDLAAMPGGTQVATVTFTASGDGMSFERTVTVRAERPPRPLRRRLPRLP